MRPENSTAVFRGDLSAIAREYDTVQAASRFIARRVAPIFESATDTGEYPIMLRSSFKKRADTSRGANGAYNRITGKFGKGTFATEEHGLEYPIDDKKRKKYARLFDAEDAATQIVRHQLLLDHEYRVAQMYANAGFTNHDVTTAWTTTDTATPLDDIQKGVDELQDKTGIPASEMSLIIPRADFREMLKTKQVNDKIMYTYPGVQPANLSADQIAGMLGIKEVLIAQSVEDSNEEGLSESNSMIWAAGVMYVTVLADENAPLETPSAARTILWTEDAPELPIVESYRNDDIRADVVRSRDETDEVLIGEKDLMVYQITNT